MHRLEMLSVSPVDKGVVVADPITLAAVSALVLSEGVRFLYDQAGEALRRRRERRSTGTPEDSQERLMLEVPRNAFDVPEGPLALNQDAVDALESELRGLRRDLAEYAQGVDEIDSGNRQILALVDALRKALEVVYGQPLVFKGEAQAANMVTVTGVARVKDVQGYVAGVRAGQVATGSVSGHLSADTVRPDGQAIGVDVESIG
ncbi:hypothetical protein ACFP2T_41595 [Plantactinospora solaniradicis]|uniref:DUF881 domain-containing protein n=1 Tax=Plantactinospora solaniradicis TaxID=1723736 RepID=A0ABW1KLQ9_9ACTN